MRRPTAQKNHDQRLVPLTRGSRWRRHIMRVIRRRVLQRQQLRERQSADADRADPHKIAPRNSIAVAARRRRAEQREHRSGPCTSNKPIRAIYQLPPSASTFLPYHSPLPHSPLTDFPKKTISTSRPQSHCQHTLVLIRLSAWACDIDLLASLRKCEAAHAGPREFSYAAPTSRVCRAPLQVNFSGRT